MALWELEASLVNRTSFRTVKTTQRNPVSKQTKENAVCVKYRLRELEPGLFRSSPPSPMVHNLATVRDNLNPTFRSVLTWRVIAVTTKGSRRS